LAAISTARRIDVLSYLLHGQILDALEAAARRGAHVTVRLESQPTGGGAGALARENRRAAAALRCAGAQAYCSRGIHAKAIAVGDAVFFDDRNWNDGDRVVSEHSVTEARAVRAAAKRGNAAGEAPSLSKRDALEREAQLIVHAAPGADIICESESLGAHNVVCAALLARARRGEHPRVLANAGIARDPKERAELELLVQAGVLVRLTSAAEKFASDGSRAWLGSANATSPYGRGAMLDWGETTRARSLVADVRSTFESRWRSAKTLDAPTS
jgi:phosphatidylserine/phosphatidylglycerophosphate/cardiolipin synthase-like enzyme